MADIQKLNVNSTTYDISTTWDKVTGKPSTFPATRKILEINPSGTATGWYRCIYINRSNASHAQTLIVSIQTSYHSPQNEHYIFAITCGYNGDIDINQLAGVRGGYLVNKIRVVWNNSGVCYFDFYKNSSGVESYRNSFRIEILSGDGTLQDGSIVSSAGGNVVEFTPIKGVKSLNGFYNNSGTSVSYDGHTHSQYITGITKSMVTTALGYTPPTSDTNTWRPVTNTYTGSDQSTCVSQYGTNALYNALVNGYASSAGTASNANAIASTGFGNSNFTYLQTSSEFFGNSGWAHYLISNHGDGSSYYNFTIGLPFWGVPIYKRLEGGTEDGWHTFITSENIGSQSVNYANSAGSAPASDVYSWAKASSKPSYTYSEVGAASSSHTHTSFANSITVTGSVSASSGFYQSSDERLKTFYDPIKVDLEKLKTLRKNYFKFNDNDKFEIGVSAQEIQAIYPEIVSENGDGYLSVAYDKLSVIALAALDEQQKEIDDLKDQLSTIKNILKEKGIL